jgi:glycosyltransferase involved in cell wall biosynthesis/tRNA A-37 threonylcarbamoyl transferase component Bud32
MPPRRSTIAVIVSRFPKITETFVLRELIELERQGQPVRLVPLLREPAQVVHPEAAPWVRRAFYTPFLSLAIVAANLRSLRRQPARHLRLLARLVLSTLREPPVLVRTLAFFPKAVYLAERLHADGIRHVHAQFATHPATVALVISELTGISFSITAHAHDLFVHQSLLPEKLARAAFVRVISGFNRDWLLSRYPALPAGRLRVIHVGIDPDAYAPLRVADHGRRDTADASATPLILCVAALQPYKGLDVLLEACAALMRRRVPFRCEIIGEGAERGRLERLIEQRGMRTVVTLRGACTADAVRAELARATIFVLPSVVAGNGQMEGIPVALMEAMAAGLPVIASDLSGIPELVRAGRTGLLVRPGDADGTAAAISALLDDPALRGRLGERGRSKVRESFALEPTVAALLHEIDAHNPPPAPEVVALIRNSSWPGFVGAAVGVRRVLRGADSHVVDLIACHRRTPQRLILKAQRSRAGESRPASERARHEFEVLGRLRAEGRQHWPRCRVPRPVHLDPENAVLVMEACRGERLDTLIRSARAAPDPRRLAGLLEAVRGAGVWLRVFQDQTREAGPGGPIVEGLRDRILDDLESCRAAGVLSRDEADAVRQRSSAIAGRLAAEDPGTTGHHGDFQPGNLFVDDEFVEAIDFEGYRRGLAAEDAGNFLAHLALYFTLFRGRRERAVAAFLEGYGHAPEEEPGLRLGVAAAALRLLRSELDDRTPRATAGRFWLGRSRRRVLRDLILRS